MEPESWTEALVVSVLGALGSGGVMIIALSSILFPSFSGFCGVGGVGDKFAICQ